MSSKKLLFFFIVFSALLISNNSQAYGNTNSCPAPTVSSFSPLSAPIGTLVTLNGSGFSTTADVEIDGISSSFTIVSDTELTVIVPDGVINSSTILVVTSGGCTGAPVQNLTILESQCSSDEIYISEVYDSETGSYGVYELYNPTPNAIVLDGIYQIDRYGTIGNPTPSVTTPLMGTINPFSTFEVELGSTGNTCTISPDMNLGAGINEDDEIRLLKNGLVIDITYTDDERGYTFIRNPDAVAPSITFDISEWTLLENENCSDLESHTTDLTPPDFMQSPSQTVCEGETTMFSVFPEPGTYTYQWKTLDALGNWVDVIDDAIFAGANTDNLLVQNVPVSLNGSQYYCEFTSSSCTIISNAVQLTVFNLPLVDTLSDQSECTSYTLPTLTNGNYFTGSGGTGMSLNAGDIITTSQTIFIYNVVGIAPNICSNESSFTVNITGNPSVDTLPNVTECVTYQLPNLTDGNYFTGSGGTGIPLNAGDNITTSQTIFIYNEIGTAPNTCSNESSFDVSITGLPPVDSFTNQTECTSYTLPTLTNGNYFTGTGGTGMPLNAGDNITTSQIVYIYNEVGTAPNVCFIETSFFVDITGNPPVDNLSDVTECTSYTLPALTDGNYFTGTGGTGMPLNAGDIITTSQTLFIFNEVGIAPNNCSNESSFQVTITGNPPVDALTNVSECTSYTLPALTNGSYFSGPSGTGMPLNSGDNITTSQTIFIYNEIGTAPNTCSSESSFQVTITGNPPVDTLSDVTECTSYTLPALTDGNYFTGTDGTGMPLNAGDAITTSQTVFIYNEVGVAPNTCSSESSFQVTITGNPPVDTLSDVTECTSYTLPALTDGNYFTGTDGTGMPLNAGDAITTSQTVFIYNEVGVAPNNCSSESSFQVTITGNPPVDALTNVTECTSYTLPVLTDGNYFTGSGGTGMPLNAGDTITTSETIFIYNAVGACSSETSFTITIEQQQPINILPDEFACGSYTLPALAQGNYFTNSNGTGTQLNGGDVLTSSQDIFIYDDTGTCPVESTFNLTVFTQPVVDVLPDITVCNGYTLPSLTSGNYFTDTIGGGTPLNAGDVISTPQTIFIFEENTNPGAVNCSDESSFTVTIDNNIPVDELLDFSQCEPYVLPTLQNGNYFTASGGNGMQLSAGDSITTSQMVFIYNEVGTAPNICSSESSFEVTILPSQDFDLTLSNITINNQDIVVTMDDISIDYQYAVDNFDFQTSNEFFNLSEGQHTLIVSDTNGCVQKSITFFIEANQFIVPLYFTPNGDGQHDFWVVTDTENIVNRIYIFNRYGKLIKTLGNPSQGWDGTYNGNLMPSSDYWYTIELRSGDNLQGHFALKR